MISVEIMKIVDERERKYKKKQTKTARTRGTGAIVKR